MKEISELSAEKRSEWKNRDTAERTTIYRDYNSSESLKELSGLSITEDQQC